MKDIRYTLSPLPYEYTALEPVISKQIMELHHDKHHQAYINGANTALELLEKARTEDMEINIKAVMRDLSFNLNGHLLHELFWQNLRPYTENNMPDKELEDIISSNFSSFDAFKKEFTEAGKTVEGSGWVALLKDTKNNLIIMQIQNHNLLGINGFTPILVNDVWEHAYYLDYKNDRGAYFEKWWNIVNWEDVKKRLQ
ncbi:MAG: superoxide dismutase [Candidatus Dojkabacteria bacterium]